MLAASRVSALTSHVARQAVQVAGQRQAALVAVRRRGNVSVRSIQSVAQTDRVR
jgi:N-acetyl-gamma-glutamyl-phosphate reductase/acetylglutamate kinase